MCFLASGSIEMENRTNTRLVVTLITCPGIFSFHFLPFFLLAGVYFPFCSVSNRLSEDKTAFTGKCLIQQVAMGQFHIKQDPFIYKELC